MIELSVLFTSDETNSESPIQVSLFRPDAGASAAPVAFTPPLGDPELADLRWYLEVFSTWPTGPDDKRAKLIESKFEDWGRALLNSIISPTDTARLWQQFADASDQNKLLTIDATDPRVLRLPWELLADSSAHLFRQKISVRRRLRKEVTTTTPRSFELPVRILVVVSRPDEAGFISPRAVSLPLLTALEKLGDRVTTEFLYPPTLTALTNRLEDETAPPVHVVHFDGHGVYDDRLGLGYLIFEDDEHQSAPVDANTLGNLLHGCGVPLIVLNACQSAKQEEETNPYASVAARLVRAGAGSVLAMNYSVLVVAAHKFVGAFYGSLAGGLTVGRSVDKARGDLMSDPKRHKLTRRNEDGDLVDQAVTLHDWFLPALYQQAQDPVVFARTDGAPPALPKTMPRALNDPAVPAVPGGLPGEPLHGFHGRARELLKLERELAEHAVVVVHGFGGLGKTALAAEAGRWFYRTGRFPGGAAFVSFEHGGSLQQLCSWVGQAVSGDPNFVIADGDPVGRVADLLRQNPALVILDNFESVLGREPVMPTEELTAVLNAVWTWAQAGKSAGTSPTGAWGSRILITTRDTTFNDARFAPSKGCAHLPLEGLAEADALELAADILDNLSIDRTTIPRQGLVGLMEHLGGHALSLYLVLPHLRDHTPAALIQDFEDLLPGFTTGKAAKRNESLLVSLDFSLRRLGEETRAALPALGVFQGVCFEDDMLKITEIDPALWQIARAELEAAALVKVERLPSVEPPFLQFHPTLLPYLGDLLQDEQRAALETRYWQRYYGVANYLYNADTQKPHHARAIAVRDMPNLRHAFDLLIRAVEAGEIEAGAAVDFATSISKFLNNFGRQRERDVLLARIGRLNVSGDAGLTKAEYLRQGQRIDMLRQQGRAAEAEQVCRDLLVRMDAGAAYNADYDRALTLGRLGRCLEAQGHPVQGILQHREALRIFERLSATDQDAKQMVGTIHTELADLYSSLGQFDDAKREYEAALVIDEEVGDLRGKGVDLAQLGTLALQQNNLTEARRQYTEALETFHALGEPQSEAVAWHQLGMVAQEEEDWDDAERCYRESLRIKESQNDLPGVAQTCNQLAIVAAGAGRLDDAERWFLREIEIDEQLGNPKELASDYNNLANLYLKQSQLDEARQYAERAAAIKETLDLSAEPWTTYNILAEIAQKQGRPEEAAQWRRKANEALDAFAGTRYEIAPILANFQGGIAGAVAACGGDGPAKAEIEARFERWSQNGWQIAEPIRRIWAGERDPDALTANIDYQDRAIVLAILHRLGVSVPALIVECLAQTESAQNPKIAEILRNFEPVIEAVVAACGGDGSARAQIEALFDTFQQGNWQIAEPIRRIWAGERDSAALTAGIDSNSAAIVRAILARLSGETPPQAAPASAAPSPAQDPVARVRAQWKDEIRAVIAACQGNAAAAASLAPFLDEMGQQDDWRALIAVLRRIMGGERDTAALLAGLDPTDTIVAGDVLRGLGVAVPEPAAPGSAAPSPAQGQQAVSLDQLLEMVKLASSQAAPPGLSEMLHMVTRQMAGDANAPTEARALGRVLNTILSGDRAPDLSGLPEELAAAVRQLLQSLA